MFCAFEGPAKILRLHGIGEVVATNHPDFASLSSYFPENPGTRAIIRIRVTRVSDSCGYGVPSFEFRGRRDSLDKWASAQGARKLEEYRKSKNKESIDGLPALGDAEP